MRSSNSDPFFFLHEPASGTKRHPVMPACVSPLGQTDIPGYLRLSALALMADQAKEFEIYDYAAVS